MVKKKHLITGGAGFIGFNLAFRLISAGQKVSIFDNLSRGSFKELYSGGGNFEFIKADIRDKTAVRNAVRGVDCVWHLAAINGTSNFYNMPDKVLEVGIKGIINILDACREEKVKDLMLASSSEVYQTPHIFPTSEATPLVIPDPFNPRYSYAATKITSEVMAIHYGCRFLKRVIIFRPHNVYGPNMGYEHVIPQFIIRMLKLSKKYSGQEVKFPIQGTGRETRSFILIDDFIDGLMLISEKGRHRNIYHIGTSEELTIKEVAVTISKYFGLKIKIVPGKLALGSTPRRCPDISKMCALGFKPKYKLKEALPLVAYWYEQNIK